MSSIHPARISPVAHHTRKTVTRAARSAPTSKTALKGIKIKPAKKEEDLTDTFEEDDDMGSSFLQFCAMCEKQIVVPNNSILYCSESCRRKDAHIHNNDPSLSLRHSLPISPTYDGDEPSGFRTRTILPHKLPTPRPLPTRIPPMAHDGKSDLDPTEWKPCEEGSAKEKPGGDEKTSVWRPKLSHRPSSHAYSYLSQFHRSAPASTRRAVIPHRSTPSLSHTPTTTASSDDSMASTPTELTEASLIPRSNTSFSKSVVVKGAELITPKFASLVSTTQLDSMKAEGTENTLINDISYDKKWVLDRKASAAGSLKKLLGGNELENTTLAM